MSYMSYIRFLVEYYRLDWPLSMWSNSNYRDDLFVCKHGRAVTSIAFWYHLKTVTDGTLRLIDVIDGLAYMKET